MSGEILLDNLTEEVSCAEQTLFNATDAELQPAWYHVFNVIQVLYYIPLIIIGVLLNVLVIFLISNYKQLQTCSFFAALQMVCLDTVLVVIIPGCIIVNAIAGKWAFGWHMCEIIGFVMLTTALARTFLMVTFALDRFLNVMAPFKFPTIERQVSGVLSTVSWALALVVGVIAFPAILDCYYYSPPSHLCFFGPTCNRNCLIFNGLFWLVIGIPASLAPIGFYSVLYCKARKTKLSLRNTQGNASTAFKNSNKANVTFFLLFLSSFLLTVPSTVAALVVNSVAEGSFIAYFFSLLSSAINPLLMLVDPIVILRNQDARSALSKLKKTVSMEWLPAIKACLQCKEKRQANAQ